ncbi:MAG: hypothetical protein ACYC3F_13115 [Gemmatimonadaceae bacterium]
MTMRRKTLVPIGALLFVGLAVAAMLVRQPSTASTDTKSGPRTNAFVGDQRCKSCHARQSGAWLSSDHFKTMRPAGDSAVKGDFNDKTYTADGITSRFHKKDGRYFIRTQGADNRTHDCEVQYTFGHRP